MKILVLNYEYPPIGGGGGIASKNLAEALVQKGHEMAVITMGGKGLPKKDRGEVKVLRTTNPKKKLGHTTILEVLFYLVQAPWIALRLRRKFKFEVIHAHFILPTGPIAYILSKIYKIPYILTAHGSDIPGHSQTKVVFWHKFTKPLIKILIDNSCKTYVTSKTLRKELEKHVGTFKNVAVAPNSQKALKIKKGQKTPKENIVFSIGRLSKQKGIGTAIKAINALKISPWEYHIYGNGAQEERLKKLAKGNKSIKFKGWVTHESEQYKKVYKTGAIALIPSLVESFGMTALEAMFNKCAIIASNIPALKETLGDAALFIEPDDVKMLAEKIQYLLNNESERLALGKRAYDRAQKLFAPEKAVRIYEEMLESAK